MLHAASFEDVYLTVIHHHREIDGQRSLGNGELGAQPSIEFKIVCGETHV